MAQLIDIMSGKPCGFPGRRRRSLVREASLGGERSEGHTALPKAHAAHAVKCGMWTPLSARPVGTSRALGACMTGRKTGADMAND